MLDKAAVLALLAVASLDGCGGSSAGTGTATNVSSNESAPVVAPSIVTKPAQNGAVVVSLISNSSGTVIYYTEDGSTPTTSSPRYQAPFLVVDNVTVKAVATASGVSSSVTSQAFAANIPSGTLAWSDEFSNASGAAAQPDPAVWTYDTGNSGFGNNELETYCAWGANTSPCNAGSPNAFVGTDGFLHIIAQRTASGAFTSARMKSQGLFSFQYGRFEVRAQVPEAQGFWPAAWLLGNSIATAGWPACGEQDVLERVNAALTPDWNEGSIHGTGFTGTSIGGKFSFPAGQTAAQWHTYGMIWSPRSIKYYVDDPTQPYATFTPGSVSGFSGAVWPFDSGPNFILLNLAVGGSWPGAPDGTTPFPSEMLVDYVRVYKN